MINKIGNVCETGNFLYNSNIYVYLDSDITFEIGIKDKNSLQKFKEFILIQIQINYTKKDGSQCVRVISQKLKITNNKELYEKDCNISILSLHVIHIGINFLIKCNLIFFFSC